MTFLAAIGAGLRRIPLWAWAVVLLLAGLFFFGRYMKEQGREEVQTAWDAQKAKDAAEIAKLKAKAGEVTVKVETKYVDRIQTVRVKGDTIVQKIPVYISRDLPELPGAFRVWLDAAATNTVPDAAREADAAPVAPVDVAATVAANYTTCLATAEQLRGLQEWVTEQKRLNP
jgi:hypothetical protein